MAILSHLEKFTKNKIDVRSEVTEHGWVSPLYYYPYLKVLGISIQKYVKKYPTTQYKEI